MKLTEEINKERLHYKLDFTDFDDLRDGKAYVEYMAHKSDHHKAAAFIRSVIAQYA